MQATAQQYVITTPNVSGTYFNVRIQLEQTEGHVGFYCNPQWGGQPEAGDTIASRNNAIWQTGAPSTRSDHAISHAFAGKPVQQTAVSCGTSLTTMATHALL